MPGAAYRRLLDRALDQQGYLTPADADAMAITPTYLRMMARRGELDRIYRGVYRFPETVIPHSPHDEYASAVLWPQGQIGTLTHETALDLYELGDVNPGEIHITVPQRHRIQRTIPNLFVVHRADLPAEDVTRTGGLPITTVRRTIADCIGADVRAGLITQAIDTGRGRAMLTAADTEQLRELLAKRFRGSAVA